MATVIYRQAKTPNGAQYSRKKWEEKGYELWGSWIKPNRPPHHYGNPKVVCCMRFVHFDSQHDRTDWIRKNPNMRKDNCAWMTCDPHKPARFHG